MKVIEGSLQAKGMKFVLVVSRFNRFITDPLLEGAIDMLKRHQVSEADIQVVWVPGAFEIPVVTQKLAEHKKFDAIICLGAVIRGHTPHFDYVANEVSKGIAAVSMKTGVPVIFGILTTETIEQAIERAGTKSGNKGAEAAMNAIEMASLLKQL